MAIWCPAVALCYALLCAAIAVFEYGRIRKNGVDPITLFMVVFLLQCSLPGVAVFALLPAAGLDEPTGVGFFDRVFRAADALSALTVFALTMLFVLFFYVGCALGRRGLSSFATRRVRFPEYEIRLSQWRVQCVLVGGLSLSLLAFYLLGDNLIERYTNLILLRSNAESVDRTILNSDALSLTQAWAWLAVLGLLTTYDSSRRRWMWALCAIYSAIFAVLGVSRRAIFLPLVLAYLAQLLRSGRWRLRWIAACAIPIGLIVVFGEEVLGVLAFGGDYSIVSSQYRGAWSGLLRTFSEVGISNVESLGTVALVNLDLRFGVDHLLSIARRVPEGIVGLDFDFPERVVRYSTAVLASPEDADIPPGFVGQMWLDFGILGPVVWGLLFGLQMSTVQVFYRLLRASWQSSAVITLIVFIVALPLNSGSFDFTFSIDIIVLVAALWWCAEIRRSETDPEVLRILNDEREPNHATHSGR